MERQGAFYRHHRMSLLWHLRPPQSGALACVYSLFVGLVLRTLRWEPIWKAIAGTTIMTGVVMIIVGYSIAMG